jgi:hypothetical protein
MPAWTAKRCARLPEFTPCYRKVAGHFFLRDEIGRRRIAWRFTPWRCAECPLQAHRDMRMDFMAQVFALDTLCGSLLQVTAWGKAPLP